MSAPVFSAAGGTYRRLLMRALEVMQNGGVSIRKPESFPCRRLPPQPDPRRPGFGEAQRANWPMTLPNEWCGEWSVRTEGVTAEGATGAEVDLAVAAE